MAIRYRIERNPLTKLGTWRLRFMPQGTAGYGEVAERVALKNPGSSAEQIKKLLQSGMEEILGLLLEGIQVTLEDNLTFRPSFHARLTTPDTKDRVGQDPYLLLPSSVMQGYVPENLDTRPDLVIVGNVIQAVFPEAQRLAELGIPYLS
ncbi:MAG: hypothetical protein D3904_12020, partial [Candidatus Electrothrix sp. EH2]|nr:hypothetical protein [Candidatus Electrothrix sp. EH2]